MTRSRLFDISSVFSGDSVRQRFARGTIGSFAGSLISQAAGMIASILCARILDREGFGELGMIRTTLLVFAFLAGTGLGMAATKFVAEWRDIDPARTGRYIGLFMKIGMVTGIGATLVCIVGAIPLAVYALKAPHLAGALMLGSAMLLFSTLNLIQLCVLIGLERFRIVAQLVALDGILNLLLIPSGASIAGVNGAVAASSLAAVLVFPLRRWYLRKACEARGIAVHADAEPLEAESARRFALPAILVGIAAQPFDWLASAILARTAGGYAELGYFAVANSWAQLILFLPGQLAAATQPILANLMGKRDHARIVLILTRGTALVAAFATVIAVLVILLSEVIVSVYGPSYRAASGVLSILAISSIFSALSGIFKNFLFACDRVWAVVGAQLMMGIVLCTIAWLEGARGAAGLALAYIFGWSSLLVCEVVVSVSGIQSIQRSASNGAPKTS
ncbi:MAG TPA: oligosaccharide flippase family protein [Burkholderiales bacterium]|nr:oligosaccharide flippase family protein [Burkholderiales bacterium]HTT19193.1 oligosaccharide flippase family protein [Candidatus Sulfotelmatobacter sp.]